MLSQWYITVPDQDTARCDVYMQQGGLLIEGEWKQEARKAVTTDVRNIQCHTHIFSCQIGVSDLPQVCLCHTLIDIFQNLRRILPENITSQLRF